MPKLLNVGCGSFPKRDDEWLYCDMFPSPNCDVVFDATKEWPFADNSAGAVKINHVLEHLENYEGFFKEAHRSLVPNGYLHVVVPYGMSSAGMSDVAHVKGWLPGSFACFQPGYGESVFNPQHDWQHPFSVEICLLRIAPSMRRLVRWPLRRWGMKIIGHLTDAYNEVSVVMRALKTPEDIAHFKANRPGNAIPVQRVMHRYEYEGKEYKGGPVELVFLDSYHFGYISLASLNEQLMGSAS